jgi:hypothetical protein
LSSSKLGNTQLSHRNSKILGKTALIENVSVEPLLQLQEKQLGIGVDVIPLSKPAV